MNHRRLVRVEAAAVCDAAGLAAAPGAVLLEITGDPVWPVHVLAAGRTADVRRHEANSSPGLRTLSRPRSVLIPGLVNAHTHLDLTHIGPQPHNPEAGFTAWAQVVMAGRRFDPEGIAASVRRGIELSLAAGVVAVGDIGGAPRGTPSLVPWRTVRGSPLRGVSFLEFFAMGANQDARLTALEERFREGMAEAGEVVRLGLQPHAPYSVSLTGYARAVELAAAGGTPLATHLAEMAEERRFVGEGSGPFREFQERAGTWADEILRQIGHGRGPVEYLAPVLESGAGRFLVAHVNDADDAAIATLARTGTSVAYCPRGSAYFAAERVFGPHRYRDMLAAGVRVALGTDSVLNLPAEAARTVREGGTGIGVLEEMRFLHRRDGTDPLDLLRMGTVHGAEALGLDQRAFRFGDGDPLAGLVAIDVSGRVANIEDGSAVESVVAGDGAPELLLVGTNSGLAANLPVSGERARTITIKTGFQPPRRAGVGRLHLGDESEMDPEQALG